MLEGLMAITFFLLIVLGVHIVAGFAKGPYDDVE